MTDIDKQRIAAVRVDDDAGQVVPAGLCVNCFGCGEVAKDPRAREFKDMGSAPCPDCRGTGRADGKVPGGKG